MEQSYPDHLLYHLQGQVEGMVIEIGISTGQEAPINKGIQHLTTKGPRKGMQGTSGHHKILHLSRIMVLLE